MALLKPGKSKRLVLDIGTSAIRLCELSQTKAGYQLTKYYQRELNLDPAADEETKLETRRSTLEALLKEAKVRTKKTIMAVPGQSVFTRNRALPPVPEYKVTQIVRYEIQQQIPFSLDQIALDYQVLDRTEAGGYDVMMAAIKVDVVEKQLEILERTKRSIDVVDVAPLAAYNWLKHTNEFGEEGECIALIDMGATTTDIVIQKDNQFRFTRSLSVGGNDVTNAIAAGFGMSFAEAEKLKRERGFAPTGDAERDGKGGEVIGRILGRLVSEVTRSFAYFRSQPGGGPIARVIVTGGGACMRNIIPFLQRELGIEVRIAQPLAGLAVAPTAQEASEHPEQACVALGLALRCVQPVPIQINLIPPRVLEGARRREQAFYWILSLATLFLIMASIIPVTAAKDEEVQDRIQLLRAVLADYDPTLLDNPQITSEKEEQFTVAKSDVKAYQDEVGKLDDARENRNFWLKYLADINTARPRGGGITISSIESAVIGGPGNTGAAARKAELAKANGGEEGAAAEEAPAEEEPAAPASPFGGGAGGMANLMQQFGAAGPGANGANGAGDTYQAVGFTGLGPSSAVGGGNALANWGNRNNSGRKAEAPKVELTEPNGLIIYGYAETFDILAAFKTNLESSESFGADRVYLHVGRTNSVSESELDNARVGGESVNAAATSGSSSGEKKGGIVESFGAAFGGAAAANVGRPSSSSNPYDRQLVNFRIDVQFLGEPQPQPGATKA